MSRGDQADIKSRIVDLLPPWFPSIEIAPVLNAVISGPAYVGATCFSLVEFADMQTRLATATDGFLDLIAYDYFGLALQRIPGQSDQSFRAQILATVLREKATHNGLLTSIQSFLGVTPIIVEPWRPLDCGGYGCYNLAYNTAGRYGNMQLRNQVFVFVTPTAATNVPIYAGYGNSVEAYSTNTNYNYYATIGEAANLADASIYSVIAQAMPSGSIAWVNVGSKLATPNVAQTPPTPSPQPTPTPTPVPVPGPVPTPPAPSPTPTPTPTPPAPTPTPPAVTPNPNIIPSTDMTTWTAFGGATVAQASTLTPDGKKQYNASFANTRSGFYVVYQFVQGLTYTVSVKATGTTPFDFNYWRGISPNDGTDLHKTIQPTAAGQVFSFTFTAEAIADTNNVSIGIVANNTSGSVAGTDLFTYIKLEEGNVATPYIDPVAPTAPAPTPTPVPGPTGNGRNALLGMYRNGESDATASTWLGFQPDFTINNSYQDQSLGAGISGLSGINGYPVVIDVGIPYHTFRDYIGTANGSYDSQIHSTFANIQGYASTIYACRLDSEFTLYSEYLAAGATVYKAAFDRVVGIGKTYLPNVKFIWNPNAENGGDVSAYLPNSADIIGIDVYSNPQYASGRTSLENWNYKLSVSPGGIQWYMNLANSVGKPLAFPEWGDDFRDGVFITKMAAFIAANNVALHAYWDSTDNENASFSSQSQAAYQAAFGNKAYTGTYFTYKQPTPLSGY